jgi:hypothetical protein
MTCRYKNTIISALFNTLINYSAIGATAA